MEFNIVHGKKETSEVFHVFQEDQLYVKKCVKSESLIYVKCYHKSCSVTGKIECNKFFHVNHANHNGHSQSVSNLMLEWKFYEELRRECVCSRDALKNIFDDIYNR